MNEHAEPTVEQPAADPRFIMRNAWIAAAVLLAGASGLWFVSPGGALTLAWLAVAWVMLNAYTAYRVGASNYRIPPDIAVVSFFASLGLALVAVVSTIFG